MLKDPIDLMSANIDQIVVSDKFNYGNNGSRYFIGYQEGEIINHYVLFYLKWLGL